MSVNINFVLGCITDLNDHVTELYEAMMDEEDDEVIETCSKLQNLIKKINFLFLYCIFYSVYFKKRNINLYGVFTSV